MIQELNKARTELIIVNDCLCAIFNSTNNLDIAELLVPLLTAKDRLEQIIADTSN